MSYAIDTGVPVLHLLANTITVAALVVHAGARLWAAVHTRRVGARQ